MYHGIVRARIRSVFASIDAGDCRPMVDGLAPDFVYRFHGQHALGGTRTTREAMLRWWERIFTVLPGARFDLQDIIVAGGPGRTRVAVRALVSGEVPGGDAYRNTVMQFLTLRWGKVTSVETLEDLQVLQAALEAAAAAGVPDALAPPIAEGPA